MICYRNNRYLHDVPECLLKKNCPTSSGLPIPVANKIQNTIQYNIGIQTAVWHILWRQRERKAVATDFLRRPYATPEWRWFWHANKIYGVTVLMLKGLYRNMPVFLVENFDSGPQSKFWLLPVSKHTNLQKSSTGKPAFESPTVMSVERIATKGQSPRLSLQLTTYNCPQDTAHLWGQSIALKSPKTYTQ